MANQEHLDLLKQGVGVWNQWRKEFNDTIPDLMVANLQDANLKEVNLSGANLGGANLNGANLQHADLHNIDLRWSQLATTSFQNANLRAALLQRASLHGANLSGADLSGADLSETGLLGAHFIGADLRGANLRNVLALRANFELADLSGAKLLSAQLDEANLTWADCGEAEFMKANLSGANLREANLRRANLMGANLTEANLTGADLTLSRVYAVSAWNVQLQNATQLSLIITDGNEPTVTADNLEVAQFIYLLLNNQKIREIIDTITSKVVLILGRFTPERKSVLDALRDELRKQNYSPVLFDFEKPTSRDLTETVSTLAHLARFIIVDLTNPSSAPHEVATIIPQCVVPVQPLLLKEDSKHEYTMFEDLRRRYHWVLPTFRYQDTAELLASLRTQIIAPAEQKAKELTQPK